MFKTPSIEKHSTVENIQLAFTELNKVPLIEPGTVVNEEDDVRPVLSLWL